MRPATSEAHEKPLHQSDAVERQITSDNDTYNGAFIDTTEAPRICGVLAIIPHHPKLIARNGERERHIDAGGLLEQRKSTPFDIGFVEPPAIHVDEAVAHVDRLARGSDDALDEDVMAGRAVRVLEDDDVARIHIPTQIDGNLLREQMVANLDSVLHRTGGDDERADDERSDEQ